MASLIYLIFKIIKKNTLKIHCGNFVFFFLIFLTANQDLSEKALLEEQP